MPRLRALLAILLTLTWCSAAWHVDLEAAGLMLEHKHHTDDVHDPDHGPIGVHQDHADVFARDVTKDQITVGTLISFAVLGLAAWLLATPPSLVTLSASRPGRETDPPFAQIWQFIWRCAPESAAPPALR